jgi:hypothetical protein
MIVRRVGILSLGKLLGVIYTVFRFLLGAFLAFFSSLQNSSASAGAMFALILVSEP